MAITRIESPQPQREATNQRSYTQIWTGTTSEVLAGSTAIGTTLAGDSGIAARVLTNTEWLDPDPQFPGRARLAKTYTLQSIDEWLLNNPGKAFRFGRGGIARKGYRFHGLSNQPVEGWLGNNYFRQSAGDNAYIVDNHAKVIHGCVSSLAALDAWICGKKNDGTMTNLGAATGDVYLASKDYTPVMHRTGIRYIFNAIFLPTDAIFDSCTSTTHTEEVVYTPSVGGTASRWVPHLVSTGAADIETSNLGSMGYTGLDDMIVT
jgi:hypothetical protein